MKRQSFAGRREYGPTQVGGEGEEWLGLPP